MIESVKDLGLEEAVKDLKDEEVEGVVDSLLQEKMGIGLEALRAKLEESLKNRADELALDLPNIAPYNDYGKMMDDFGSMSEFLRDESSKPENWIIHSIMDDAKNKALVKFTFVNKSVDDGHTLQGLVFVSKSGVVRHAFAQVDL